MVADILRANIVTRFNLILGVLLAVILVVGEPQDALFGIVLGQVAAGEDHTAGHREHRRDPEHRQAELRRAWPWPASWSPPDMTKRSQRGSAHRSHWAAVFRAISGEDPGPWSLPGWLRTAEAGAVR